MRIIQVTERQPFSLPITEVMGEEGGFSFLSHVHSKGYFDIDFRGNELVLVAGKYIGQIPLTADITIHVRPKIPIANLARVVDLANQPIHCLDFFRRTYQLEGSASQTLLEAMARSLVSLLSELDAEGVYREYLARKKLLVGQRGRVDIPSFMRSCSARGLSSRIPCAYFELSADTILNRVIKKAIDLLGNALSQQSNPDSNVIAMLTYYADVLGSVTLDNSSNLVEAARDHLLRVHVPDLRGYYLPIIDVCLIILGGSGVELMEQSGMDAMHSLIVNLEGVFEEYIRQVLRASQRLRNESVKILDGNKEGRSTLFSDSRIYEAKPDLVIGSRENVRALADVKYKTKLNETDRYQLIAHSAAYGARRAILVTPVAEGSVPGGSYVGKVGTTDPLEMFHYQFDLGQKNLGDAEARFQAWVENLVLMQENVSP